MAKAKTAYVCADCGAEHSKWQGQCTECGVWNTLSEFVVQPATKSVAINPRGGYAGAVDAAKVTQLATVATEAEQRSATGIAELDRVLGGGLVDRLGGADRRRSGHRQVDLAAADARRDRPARARAVRDRRGKPGAGRRRAGSASASRWTDCEALAETSIERILGEAAASKPNVLIIDSIQTIWTETLTAAPGSVSPGARSRGAAGALREGNRHQRVPGRPRDQGRRHRRPARARAHGRCGAVFRGRGGQPLPHPARVQEPLRRGQRTRRVRDGRQGPARGAQSVGDFPVRARAADRRQRGHGDARRHAAAAGRGAGAGRPELARQSAPRRARSRTESPGDAARGAASPRRRGGLRPGRVRQRGRRHPRAGNRGRPAGAAGGAVELPRPAAAGQDGRRSAKSACPARSARCRTARSA